MWKVPRDDELIEEAKRLGLSIEAFLTTDGKQLACTALKDFDPQINGVTLHFRGGERIRDRRVIGELQNGRCSDIVTVEPELQQRLLEARAHRRAAWLWLLALVSAGASILSAAAAWFAVSGK